MDDSGILNLRFNQSLDCFVCCTDTGLKIYNVDPVIERARFGINVFGSVTHCEMLYNTNIIAVVSGGRRPKYPDNILTIFDTVTKKELFTITFPNHIVAVRMRRDKLIVAIMNQIHVFSFPSPVNRLFSLETRNNDRGLCEVTTGSNVDRPIMVFPGHKIGTVQIVDLTNTELSSSSSPVSIAAHKGEITNISLNQQGTKIATASKSGTLIRVWDTATRTMIIKLRRGVDSANFYCLNFSLDSRYLCCSSDKGTVHIFNITKTQMNDKNATVYDDSYKSIASFQLLPDRLCRCAFGPDKTVYAICDDGSYHKYVFNENIATRNDYHIFLESVDEY